MSSFRDALVAVACVAAAAVVGVRAAGVSAPSYPGIGRAATPKEVAAWDIDVRPDFQGLPKGSGSVAQGQDVWEAKCSSCHGVFGESNEVFSALIGGTTAGDVETGHVARLNDPAFPGRTTLMKLATVSTLWDYIRRAMPWNAPKSLSTDEVYAVTAFLLNLGGVVPDSFVLSDRTMAQAQARMPNRNGMTTDHGLWPGRTIGNAGKPDVQAVACMSDCASEPKVRSMLPDFARNSHGNLALQNRMVGAQIGADTGRPPGSTVVASVAPPAAAPAANPAQALLTQHACMACHGVDSKIVGPALRDVAKKYAGREDAAGYLAGKIRSGGVGLWGPIAMPPQTLSADDANQIARWLADGAK